MRTSEVLNRAADLIETHGWGQGCATWSAAGGEGLCLEGGIMAAMGAEVGHSREFHYCPAHVAVTEYLGRDLDGDFAEGGGVYLWNDHATRTAAEVIEVLRAAAAIEQAREAELAEMSA